MKIKVSYEFDTSTGDYEMTVNNLSNPGEGIPLSIINEAVSRITNNVKENQIAKNSALPQVSEVDERKDN